MTARCFSIWVIVCVHAHARSELVIGTRIRAPAVGGSSIDMPMRPNRRTWKDKKDVWVLGISSLKGVPT